LFSKLKEIVGMYDFIIAGGLSKTSIVPIDYEDVVLNGSSIGVGFNHLETIGTIRKTFIIQDYPAYIPDHFIDNVRSVCLLKAGTGLIVTAHIKTLKYSIPWGSNFMKNKLKALQRIVGNTSEVAETFKQRDSHKEREQHEKLRSSMDYYTQAEMEDKRTTCKVMVYFELSAERSENGREVLVEGAKALTAYMAMESIVCIEANVSMLDFNRSLGAFSNDKTLPVWGRLNKKIFTDDVLSRLNSFKQGLVGVKGLPIGMDIQSKSLAYYPIKADPERAENILIAGFTGSGKSLLAKQLIPYLLAMGHRVVVNDFEGDEYTPMFEYFRGKQREEGSWETGKYTLCISMGDQSSEYYDPMEIGELTGDSKIDSDLMKTSMRYTIAMFRLMMESENSLWSDTKASLLSDAVRETYLNQAVTEDSSTWGNSQGLYLIDVYKQLLYWKNNKIKVDEASMNAEHLALIEMERSCSIYFKEGSTHANAFSRPIPLTRAFQSMFIIFSFGVRGEDASTMDPKILALKQMSVSALITQLTNHSKYVLKTFTSVFIEEFQRYGALPGSAAMMINFATGFRKRGGALFVITNNLAEILDRGNKLGTVLMSNFNLTMVGAIPDAQVLEDFVERRKIPNVLPELLEIANSLEIDSNGKSNSPYKNAFCVTLGKGTNSVLKAELPPVILKSGIFRTGVEVGGGSSKVKVDR
jgi:hypothetical protein